MKLHSCLQDFYRRAMQLSVINILQLSLHACCRQVAEVCALVCFSEPVFLVCVKRGFHLPERSGLGIWTRQPVRQQKTSLSSFITLKYLCAFWRVIQISVEMWVPQPKVSSQSSLSCKFHTHSGGLHHQPNITTCLKNIMS